MTTDQWFSAHLFPPEGSTAASNLSETISLVFSLSGGVIQHVCSLHGFPRQSERPPDRWDLHDSSEHGHQPRRKLALHHGAVAGGSVDLEGVPRSRRPELRLCSGSWSEWAEQSSTASSDVRNSPGLSLFPPPAVCEGRGRLCNNARRLLRGVPGVRGDRVNLVALVREEDEAAAGAEPRGVEVPCESVTTQHAAVSPPQNGPTARPAGNPPINSLTEPLWLCFGSCTHQTFVLRCLTCLWQNVLFYTKFTFFLSFFLFLFCCLKQSNQIRLNFRKKKPFICMNSKMKLHRCEFSTSDPF